MEKGTPIERTWICITFEGDAVVDWGDGYAQDLYSGDLLEFDETKYSHMATDNDLAMLQRAARVSAYDSRYVYLNNLPDRHLILEEMEQAQSEEQNENESASESTSESDPEEKQG
jgi:hypothetical protein